MTGGWMNSDEKYLEPPVTSTFLSLRLYGITEKDKLNRKRWIFFLICDCNKAMCEWTTRFFQSTHVLHLFTRLWGPITPETTIFATPADGATYLVWEPSSLGKPGLRFILELSVTSFGSWQGAFHYDISSHFRHSARQTLPDNSASHFGRVNHVTSLSTLHGAWRHAPPLL